MVSGLDFVTLTAGRYQEHGTKSAQWERGQREEGDGGGPDPESEQRPAGQGRLVVENYTRKRIDASGYRHRHTGRQTDRD